MNTLNFEEHRAYLLSIANRKLRSDLRSKVSSGDLVQETFLAAWEASQNGLNEPRDLQKWLSAILRNRVGRLHRRYITAARRTVVLERSLGDVAEPSQSHDAEQVVIRTELSQVLLVAVTKLRCHEREILTWRLELSMSWDEIAQQLDSSAESARKVFQRTLLKLRGLIPSDWVPEQGN